MIKLLKKIRRILLPNRFKHTGPLRSLNDWFWSKSSRFIGFLERTKEVILFIPVLFKCVTWDHSSIYYILRHWLGRMELVQRNDSHHINAPKYADQIKLCTLLLDRIIKDDYHDMIYADHNKKWGPIEMDLCPVKDGTYYKSIISRPNAITEEEKEQEIKEYRSLMYKEPYMVNQDINMLFDTIKKKHIHWWC